MPSCRPDILSEVLYLAMSMCPRTILDVGVGYGKWGVLCTEYLKYWKEVTPKVDGVEVFEDYKSPAHGIYNEIIYDNVMNLLDRVGGYDLVLAVDVIEHLSREDGLKFMGAIKNRYIISTPGYWSPQGASFGNEHERHVSVWTADDFTNCTVVQGRTGAPYLVGFR